MIVPMLLCSDLVITFDVSLPLKHASHVHYYASFTSEISFFFGRKEIVNSEINMNVLAEIWQACIFAGNEICFL